MKGNNALNGWIVVDPFKETKSVSGLMIRDDNYRFKGGTVVTVPEDLPEIKGNPNPIKVGTSVYYDQSNAFPLLIGDKTRIMVRYKDLALYD